MNRLCILCAGHPADDARVFHRQAKTLRQLFGRVTLICPHERPRETIDQIEIVGISRRRSYWNRLGLLKELHQAAAGVEAEVYLCHELDSLMVGCAIRARRPRARLVFDCHEYHPESFSEHLPAALRRSGRNALAGLEQALVRRCDMVVTVNEILAAKFRRYCRKVHVIENYPPKDAWPAGSLATEKQFDLVYGGHINRVRGALHIARMLQAAADMGRRLTLLVVGRFLDEECRQAVEAIVQGHGLVPWKVTGTVPYRQVGGNLSAARIGLACYDVSLWRNQWGVPVKLLEYMSVGLPVLGNDFPLQRRLIYQSRSGRCVDVSDARGFAAAAVEMLDDPAGLAEMGRRGRRAVEEQYCWEVLQPRLLAAYKSLLT